MIALGVLFTLLSLQLFNAKAPIPAIAFAIVAVFYGLPGIVRWIRTHV